MFLTDIRTSRVQRQLTAENLTCGLNIDYENWEGNPVQDPHFMKGETEARKSDTQKHKVFDIKHQNDLIQIMSDLKYCQKRVIHRSKLMPYKHFLNVMGAVYKAGVTGPKECFVWSLVPRPLRELYKLQEGVDLASGTP